MDNGTYIMYSDHTSDTAIKLCGRVDCKHSDNSCNAFFPYAENICYYDGHLYIETGFGANVTITRLDLDGTNRIKVMDTSYLAGDYRGSNGVYITNGICVFSLFKLDADGKEISDQYYWKLDGTMEQAKRTPELIMFYSAGAELLMKGKSNSDSMSSNGLYLWDIDTNTSHYLTDLPTSNPGYWGTETGYYVQDGVIYKKRILMIVSRKCLTLSCKVISNFMDFPIVLCSVNSFHGKTKIIKFCLSKHFDSIHGTMIFLVK